MNCQGYKSDCVLNVTESFEAIENYQPDILHDLLEGSIRYNFKLLISYLTSKKLFTVEELNQNLKDFKYGRISRNSKVPDSLFTSNSTYKISASHIWTRSRILMIVSDILKNDPYYLNFLEIADIFRYLMKELFDLDGLEYLKNKIGN